MSPWLKLLLTLIGVPLVIGLRAYLFSHFANRYTDRMITMSESLKLTLKLSGNELMTSIIGKVIAVFIGLIAGLAAVISGSKMVGITVALIPTVLMILIFDMSRVVDISEELNISFFESAKVYFKSTAVPFVIGLIIYGPKIVRKINETNWASV